MTRAIAYNPLSASRRSSTKLDGRWRKPSERVISAPCPRQLVCLRGLKEKEKETGQLLLSKRVHRRDARETCTGKKTS